jgi:hypothetical protein
MSATKNDIKKNSLLEVGKLSAEELKALEAEHTNIITIVLDVNKNEKSYLYLRKWKRQHIEQAYVKSAKEGLLVAGSYLLENLFVAGDKRCLSIADADTDIALGASFQVGKMVEFITGEVIKNF